MLNSSNRSITTRHLVNRVSELRSARPSDLGHSGLRGARTHSIHTLDGTYGCLSAATTGMPHNWSVLRMAVGAEGNAVEAEALLLEQARVVLDCPSMKLPARIGSN